MSVGSQHKLDRVRPPRVQITYDVETGGAVQKKDIPFVVGVMADLSGKPEKPLPKLKERTFVKIDRDNFNEVLAGSAPRLALKVANKLEDDGSQLSVELRFNSMNDFRPQNVAAQVRPLKRLLDIRQRLTELLAKMDGNDNLVDVLGDVIHQTDRMKVIASSGTHEEPA